MTDQPGVGDQAFTELTARRLGPVRRYFVRHPVAMDLLVVAIFGLPAVLGALSNVPGTRPASLLLAVLGAVALIWRRRAPMWTAGAIGVLGVVTLALTGRFNGYDLAVGLVVYAVAASHPPRTAWLTLFGLCAVVSGAIWLWEHPVAVPDRTGITFGRTAAQTLADMRFSSITTLVIFALAAIAIGISVRNRRLHVTALVDRANRLAVERDQQVALATAGERARIAREMHDVVAHSLSVMIALADGAGVALDRSPERAREAVSQLSATGRAALADMRRVLGVLRDPDAPLEPQPGAPDLVGLVEGFRSAGLPVRTTFAGPPLPPDTALQLTVFRIVQESLTNVLRHAPGARRVDLVVARAGGWVEITVTDDGAASPTPARAVDHGGGRGLIGMRERAAVYGGVIEAGPHEGGWRTHALLAWDEEDE